MTTPREVPCVGAIVIDDRGRLLLVQRANPPAQGRWSLPGGRVEAGERWENAVLRELHEETGISGVVERHVGELRRDAPDGSVYVIHDYLVRVDGTEQVRAGDDALAAEWYAPEELADLDTSDGLAEILQGWGVLSR